MSESENDTYQELCESLTVLLTKLSTLSVKRPILAYRKISSIKQEFEKVKVDVNSQVCWHQSIMEDAPIGSMRDVMSSLPVMTVAMQRISHLRMLAFEVGSCIDQKVAFSFSFFSLYVAIATSIVSLLFAL